MGPHFSQGERWRRDKKIGYLRREGSQAGKEAEAEPQAEKKGTHQAF